MSRPPNRTRFAPNTFGLTTASQPHSLACGYPLAVTNEHPSRANFPIREIAVAGPACERTDYHLPRGVLTDPEQRKGPRAVRRSRVARALLPAKGFVKGQGFSRAVGAEALTTLAN